MLLRQFTFNVFDNLLKPRSLFSKNSIWRYKNTEPKEFIKFNEKIYPPQGPDETPRPAFICHAVENVRYSPDKLWYVACFVRGMTIDEAIKQLGFIKKKGAGIVKEALLEAQAKAVAEHSVEFKSNLWVSESFVESGVIIKGLRRHARGKMFKLKHRYSNYFVTLEEGTPPKNYYFHDRKKSGEELLSEWLEERRKKKVIGSL